MISFVRKALGGHALPCLDSAGIFPLVEQIENFALALCPHKPGLVELLRLFLEMSNFHPEVSREAANLSTEPFPTGGVEGASLYSLCSAEEILDVASYIQDSKLRLRDQLTLSLAPVDVNDRLSVELIQSISNGLQRGVATLPEPLLELPKIPRSGVRERSSILQQLESLFKAFDLYLWLGWRYGDGAFCDMEEAAVLREEVADRINELLITGFRIPPKRGKPLKRAWIPKLKQRKKMSFNG